MSQPIYFHSCYSPSADIGKEMTELQLEGTSADISFVKAGHLTILPTIPMIHETKMNVGNARFLMKWSQCTTPSEKIEESIEAQKLYQNILFSLNKYF